LSCPAPLRSGFALAFAGLLVSCAVGPETVTPDAPVMPAYVAGAAPEGHGLPLFENGARIPQDWWRLFGSPEIDALVQQALARSPSLDLARARVTQARELLAARSGATTWPQVNALAGASRQLIDPATFGFPQAPVPPPFNVFSLGASVSYDLDLFGGHQRELQALAAEVNYQQYELDAARLSLAGDVVGSAIRLATLHEQIEDVAALIDSQGQQLRLNEQRQDLGAVSALGVHQQRSQLAAAQTALPALRAQRELAAHQLAVLTGDAPALARLPGLRLEQIALPGKLPLLLPAQLVRQRPDIRASEALLQKAGANVGVATADLYPKLALSGSFSTSQLDLSQVFSNGINVWSLGANLVQPIFRGGELQARKRGAEAAYEQSLAGYRQAVLLGLKNVADVLRLLEADTRALSWRDAQAKDAEAALRIARSQYEIGAVSKLALLDSERAARQARLDRSAARAGQLVNAAALLQALGGGSVVDTVKEPAPN
jgi:NodT family efflux transporter outer membrane factor (OMF) lipoprotein